MMRTMVCSCFCALKGEPRLTTQYSELRIDDTVFIRHTKPISARKRFTLEKILKSPIGEAVAAKEALQAAAADVDSSPVTPTPETSS